MKGFYVISKMSVRY